MSQLKFGWSRRELSTKEPVSLRGQLHLRISEGIHDPLYITVHAVALGDIAFATNKFELYQDFMHRVQARSPFIQTFLLQLAGDGGGSYLATERSQQNKGYGASLYCNWIGFEGGQQWVEGVLENLNEMKQQLDET